MTHLKANQISASLDGVELAYWTQKAEGSDSRSLVLIHGGASNHTRWSEFAELTALNQDWNMIIPDMRGNADSMTRKNINIASWCRDLNDILAAEKVESAIIIGHSLGAQIAIHYAHRYPAKVRGLALIDTVFESSLQGKSLWVQRLRWLIKGIVEIILGFNWLGLRRRSFQGSDLRELDKETREALQGSQSFEEIAKRYSALGPIIYRMPVANYLRQALATVSPLPPLEDIGVPVLALISGGTTMAKLESSRQEVAKFSDSEIVMLNANHWPLTETPEAVREAIENWVLKISSC